VVVDNEEGVLESSSIRVGGVVGDSVVAAPDEAAVVAAKGNITEDEDDFGIREDAQQSTDCTQTTINKSTNSIIMMKVENTNRMIFWYVYVQYAQTTTEKKSSRKRITTFCAKYSGYQQSINQ
jgi:hypothetical protein